jgi:hypothetical protein
MLAKSILALLMVLIAFILPLDLNPVQRQLQDFNVMEVFAGYLKAKKGQKHVFLLYQQENIPLIGDFAEMTNPDKA